MDDLRERVFNALGRCESYGYCEDEQCPYYENTGCLEQLRKDALSLLKAQEPVEPIEIINDFYPIGDPLRTEGWRCGKCKQRIAWDDNYCSKCGTAVKWVE